MAREAPCVCGRVMDPLQERLQVLAEDLVVACAAQPSLGAELRLSHPSGHASPPSSTAGHGGWQIPDFH